ncbi:hypothetical protein PLESTB_000758500 [Pleodorina starrii]|uniref:Rad60/SUMO-like domain-containing protein n=1 Tax=Pleodorina starrii TaxID=330485 RepID=A0A9W6F271_9CHLO|nr:hypothetical protein PLESTB_000758500 [Pleodorina starrii]GLC65782.1 hypothetical protein PLESTF_000339300 [Pleodorina starrii]
MSDLWDYDDEDQDNGGTWHVASPDYGAVGEQEETTKKRKGKPGRKAGKASKKRAVSPADNLALQPVQMPTTILLGSDDDDDDDDLVMLPSPVVAAGRGGGAGASGAVERNPDNAAPAPRPAVANLNPATQQSLAKEQEVLRALQQVTERENQLDDETDPSPLPSVSRLPHLGFSRLTGRMPMPALGTGAAGSGSGWGMSDDDDDVVLAAEVSAPTGAAAHAARGAPEPAGLDAHDAAGPTGAAGPAPVLAADRVQLKLVWGRDKEDCLKMRVVKTDPFSKMVEKFREIAKQRNLCRDINKIKFLFDGDDLAKMPDETPESLDMEDDMMIDVKL